MAPEDLLLAARDVMRERGMARNTYEDDSGAVCLSGAVRVASSGDAIGLCDSAAYTTLVAEVLQRYGAGLAIANDFHIATLDEACDVLEAAAERAAQGGEAR